MKKFTVLLLVLSLVFLPVFCSGKREVSLKTILLGSNEAQTSSIEKQSEPLSQPQKLIVSSIVSKNSDKNYVEEMTSGQIVSEIITTSKEATSINQATLKSLAVTQSEADRLAEEVAENTIFITSLQTDLVNSRAQAQNLSVEVAEKEGEVDTLKEKLKNKKSYKFVLVGANYNLQDGYGLSIDTGVKFDCGLMTSVGVSLPLDDVNPISALDVNNYTFNTKIGFAW